MSKSKKSTLIALTAICSTLLNGLFGLVITKLIITTYGSDFNGLNSTASQFISMLLIIEGGFTLATNVALFKPLANSDYKSINKIMAATKVIFKKIGLYFLLIGIILSIGYAMVLKSDLPPMIIVLTLLMTVISTSFNLFYATKYRILLQTEQREYILNIIKIGTLVLSQVLIIVVIFSHGHMLLVRFVTMIGAIINSLLIGYACKKYYSFIDFNVEPNFKAIKGTKDVFIQKFTGMIYSTMPIVFISATVGTLFASVYFVYNSVFTLLKSIIYSLINAPRMGLGKLIAEKNKEYVLKVFIQYEFIVINVMLCLLTTAAVLIIPFISIYTKGINDFEYVDGYIAMLLILITFFEIIHIPSGNIINMSGNFKIARKIQSIASAVLIIFMIFGNLIFGFYGILIAVMITAIILAVLEIGYVHRIYFRNLSTNYFKILLPNVILAIIIVYFELMLLPVIKGYLQFMFAGTILVGLNGTVFIIFNLIVNRSITNQVLRRSLGVIKKRLT